MSKNGIGSHTKPNNGTTNDWITPEYILKALGEFDLDPCASITQPWPTAKKMYNIDDDGFNKAWFGRVWLNPPYGKETGRWLLKLAEHKRGIALVFARTETKMFFESVWSKAHSIFFFEGRLFFFKPDGTRGKTNAGGPSVLISYSRRDSEDIETSNLKGKHIYIN